MPLTELKKWSATIYKPKTGIDAAQIPAVGALVTVYRRGATVSTGPVVIDADGGENDISVYDIGRLGLGQQVSVGTSNKTMYVIDIYSATSIRLSNPNVQAITVAAGDRLVIRALTDDGDFLGIKLYQDVTGATVWNRGVPGFTINNANGFVEFYTTERFFDYIVSGTGLTTTLYRDEESGNKSPAWVNVKDYQTFQDAIDALPGQGGVVYIPTGNYNRNTVPAVVPMTISKRVKMLGDGYSNGDYTGGTRVEYRNFGTEDKESDLLTITATAAAYGFEADGITFAGAGASGGGQGLVLATARGMHIRNCRFVGFPSYALATENGAENVNDLFTHCTFEDSYSNALVGFMVNEGTVHGLVFNECDFIPKNNTRGVECTTFYDQLTFNQCIFETAQADAADKEMLYFSPSATVGYKLTVQNCYFDMVGTGAVTPASWLIKLIGTNISPVIAGNKMGRANLLSTSFRFLYLDGPTAPHGIRIADNWGLMPTGKVTIGADDIIFGGSIDAAMTGSLSNNMLSDNTAWQNQMSVTSIPDAVVRAGDGNGRIRPRSATNANIIDTTGSAGLRGPAAGDMAFDGTYNVMRAYGTDAQWHALNMFFNTGTPGAGKWAKGDLCCDLTNKKTYICSVGGTPGTWTSYMTVLP